VKVAEGRLLELSSVRAAGHDTTRAKEGSREKNIVRGDALSSAIYSEEQLCRGAPRPLRRGRFMRVFEMLRAAMRSRCEISRKLLATAGPVGKSEEIFAAAAESERRLPMRLLQAFCKCRIRYLLCNYCYDASKRQVSLTKARFDASNMGFRRAIAHSHQESRKTRMRAPAETAGFYSVTWRASGNRARIDSHTPTSADGDDPIFLVSPTVVIVVATARLLFSFTVQTDGAKFIVHT